jgi:hypothetical protein
MEGRSIDRGAGARHESRSGCGFGVVQVLVLSARWYLIIPREYYCVERWTSLLEVCSRDEE